MSQQTGLPEQETQYQVASEVTILIDKIHYLNETLKHLEERLGDILLDNPEDPKGCTSSPKECTSSPKSVEPRALVPLAIKINSANQMISGATQKILDILNKCEL